MEASLISDDIPVITFSNQQSFSYHHGMKSWMRVADSFYPLSDYGSYEASHPLSLFSLSNLQPTPCKGCPPVSSIPCLLVPCFVACFPARRNATRCPSCALPQSS